MAAVTHKHPLAFLPAAMITHLIYQLIRLDEADVKPDIANIALALPRTLDHVYKDKYSQDKHHLAELTQKAVSLAKGEGSDEQNIRVLGKGRTADEAWAIALYCVVRHIDSVEDAIIAAVNHSGSSDSTGAICGNIMGAVYGYEAIKSQRLFCPDGRNWRAPLSCRPSSLPLPTTFTQVAS